MPDTSKLHDAAVFSKKLGKYWDSVLQYASEYKNSKEWLKKADRANTFYTGDGPVHEFFGFPSHGDRDNFTRNASMLKRYHKVFEFIRIMTPELYFRNPILTVNVRNKYSPDGPAVEEFAKVLRDCINYHYDEIDFVKPRKQAVVNYLLSGRGVLLTMPERLYDDTLIIREKDITYKDFLIDPTARRMEDVTWMGHRDRMAKSEMIKKYGIEANEFYSEEANPNELIEYVTIYSRLGLFGGLTDEHLKPEEVEAALKEYGDIVKITFIPKPFYEHANKREGHISAVASYGPRVLSIENWEVPFWRDTDPNNRWPYTLMDAHYAPGSLFPLGPVTAALGEAIMINWAATFLALRQKNTTREIVGLHPGVDEKTLEILQNSHDMAFVHLPVDDNGGVGNAFTKLSLEADLAQHMAALQFWIAEFDIRTGLGEVRYSAPTQSRSAEDAAQKGRVANRVIDGLFASVESAMTLLGRKHAFAWRFLAKVEDVEAIVGPERAAVWEPYQEGTLDKMARDYNVSILGDTMRRPNKAQKQEIATLQMENLIQLAIGLGDIESINKIIDNWQEELGVPEWKKIQLTPPPPPPPEEPPAPAGPALPSGGDLPPDLEGTSINVMPGLE